MDDSPYVIADFAAKKAYIAFHRFQLEGLVKALEENKDAPIMLLEITFTEVFEADNETRLMFK